MSTTMTEDERQQFLSGLHVGIISIPRAGKGPLTVPIWYDYTPGGDVWMITGEASMKGRLIARSNRVSLCAQTEAAPYKYVSVEGPVTIDAVGEDDLLHMATRYLGEQGGKAYAAGSSNEGSIKVRLSPEQWLSVDYSKAAG